MARLIFSFMCMMITAGCQTDVSVARSRFDASSVFTVNSGVVPFNGSDRIVRSISVKGQSWPSSATMLVLRFISVECATEIDERTVTAYLRDTGVGDIPPFAMAEIARLDPYKALDGTSRFSASRAIFDVIGRSDERYLHIGRDHRRGDKSSCYWNISGEYR